MISTLSKELVAGDRKLIEIVINFMMYRRAVIVACVFLVLRFFRLLQFHKRTALVGELLSIASSELLHFCAVYLPVHFALVWTAVLLYGSESASFHTFLDALHFMSIVFIGDPAIPEDVLERHSVSPYIFFWLYVVFSSLFFFRRVFVRTIGESRRRSATHTLTSPPAPPPPHSLRRGLVYRRSRRPPLLPHRYFVLTSLIMSNVLLSIFVSAYSRMQRTYDAGFLVSLLHIAGRSVVLAPQQIVARIACCKAQIVRIVRAKGAAGCCLRGECSVRDDPIAKLRTIAQLQKGTTTTKAMRTQLKAVFSSYQADRIVTQMQHFDRVQEQRKQQQIRSLSFATAGASM